MNTEKIALLMVGSELLDGRTIDTNSQFLISELTRAGLTVSTVLSCTDNHQSIGLALRYAVEAASVVIISGGLGPTTDDLTREAVADFIDSKLVLHGDVLGRLEAYFRGKKRPFDPSNCKQALFPERARTINNPVGSALGFSLRLNCGDDGNKCIIALPGVPSELKAMWRESVLTMLTADVAERRSKERRILRVFGLPEAVIGTRIESSEPDKGISIAYRVHFPEVEVVFTGSDHTKLARTVRRAKSAIQEDYIYSEGEEFGIERVIAPLLTKRGITVATAESCTGGLVGHLLTAPAGASKYYLGGAVTYTNALKSTVLGVPPKILREHGAVSAEVAEAMARGALTKLGSKVALSVTGIAGPSGGSAQKPVGLFYVGIATPRTTHAYPFFLSSTRDNVRRYAAWMALDVLRRHLCRLEVHPHVE